MNRNNITIRLFLKATLFIAILNIAAPTTSHGEEQNKHCHLINSINKLDGTYEMLNGTPWQHDPLTKALTNIHNNASEKRLSFSIEQAFHTSWIKHPAGGTSSSQTWYLLHPQMEYNLIRSSNNEDTCVSLELSGSSILSKKKQGNDIKSLDDAYGLSAPAHNDIFEDGMYYLPELLISQGINKGKTVVMLGLINQANYLDTNSYANNAFGQFTNFVFVNNQVLPLVDSNLGAIVQTQVSDTMYMQLAGSMIDNGPNRNPFKHTAGKNFNLIGEIGTTYKSSMGEGACRIQPFCYHQSGYNLKFGLALNCEQQLGNNSPFAFFSRIGQSTANTGNPGGAGFQISSGIAVTKPFESIGLFREGDSNFLGLGFAVTKPDKALIAEGNNTAWREMITELTYTFSISRFWAIQPTFQFVKNPATRNDVRSANIFAIQSILYF